MGPVFVAVPQRERGPRPGPGSRRRFDLRQFLGQEEIVAGDEDDPGAVIDPHDLLRCHDGLADVGRLGPGQGVGGIEVEVVVQVDELDPLEAATDLEDLVVAEPAAELPGPDHTVLGVGEVDEFLVQLVGSDGQVGLPGDRILVHGKEPVVTFARLDGLGERRIHLGGSAVGIAVCLLRGR